MPFGYKLAGNKNTDDVISNEQVFATLLSGSAYGLEQYLNVVKNGLTTSEDDFLKVGTNGLINLIRSKIDADQQALFDKMVANIKIRLNLEQTVATKFDVNNSQKYLDALISLNEDSLQ
ncbi:UNVERIFIED_CONTAM: hypothetical protein O8I53_06235 [Campylobacter lari]